MDFKRLVPLSFLFLATIAVEAQAAIPNAPSGLSATVASSSQINLTWTDASANENGFKIERCKGAGCTSFAFTALVGANVRSWSNGGLAASTSYSYRVRAYNTAGNSGYSNAASTTTQSLVAARGTPLWSHGFGGWATIDTAKADAVAVDSMGDLFVTGRFRGNVDFGGSARRTASSDYDIFLAKYRSSGTLLWVQQFGGTNDEEALGIAVDNYGDVFIAGYFLGTTNLGGGPVASLGWSDGFVAKYSGSTGAHMWSKPFGSLMPDSAYAVAVDGAGSVYVTGYFQGSCNFGNGPISSAGSRDSFLVKYSSSGAISWSRRFGGTGADAAENVAVDGSGNVILLGTFNGTVNFGGTSLVSSGSNDIVLAKYTGAGAHLWSRRFGDSTGESAHGLAAKTNGDIAITGEFVGTIDFGCGALVNVSSSDTYLARFNSAGTCAWSKRFGTTTTLGIVGKALAFDGTGNLALTGSISGNVDLGNGTLVGSSVDPYLAKFSSDGTAVWSKRFTGAYADDGNGVAIDSNGYVSFAGDFYESVNLGTELLESPWPTDMDGFVARYTP